jgi:hypothetical protein
MTEQAPNSRAQAATASLENGLKDRRLMDMFGSGNG